jgi:hypothetical protein
VSDDDRTVVHLPPSVVADALSVWMAGFQEHERRVIASLVSGGPTGLDVPLFHRVEREARRLEALCEDRDH